MLIDWLSREGGIVLSWWLLVTLAGVAALPLCLRLLGGLPDRGYTLARAAGLLLVGFVFWLLASLGFLRNTTDSMALAWLVVLIAGLALFFGAGGERIDLRAWWRDNSRVVIVGEIVFFVLLFGWAMFRAYQNNLSGTEKPMELAFLSATMRSEVFPPADPWLSGYAISYYYFGYVIMAMLSMLSGIASTVGFNMTNALLFALTGLGVFGVVYNLVRSRDLSVVTRKRSPALWVGVLGMVLVIFLSNFEMIFVEIPYQTRSATTGYLQLWNLNGRQTPLEGEGGSDVTSWEYWWWWHGARVISDRNLDGNHTEVIDEFPGFSFLLSDNHPHVLALPFAALALGLALNTLLTRRKPNRYEIVFYSLIFGGLIFLNTWDGPIYLIVLVAAEALRRLMQTGRLRRGDWGGIALLGVELALLALLFYLPFIAAFRSQAAGISPNLLNPTMPGQSFLMFGPYLLLVAPFLAVEAWRAGRRMNWRFGIQTGGLILVGLFVLMLLLALVGYFVPALRAEVENFVISNGGWATTVAATFAKRIAYLPTAVLLTFGLILAAGRLFARRDATETDGDASAVYSPQTGFALLLVAAALVLILVPEFVYLRDNFSGRMNTVFKFYFQAWLMLGIGGAYGVYSVFAGVRVPSPGVRAVYAGLAVVVVIAGLLYPLLGIQARMFVETGRLNADGGEFVTLNGGGTISGMDDYEAALCLAGLVSGTDAVLASAVGGSYNWPAGIASTYTGIPTVFNWPFHEVQWRGATYGDAAGTREQDMDTLYRDPTWNTTQSIIDQYGIDYIVFGAKERSMYRGTEETKFLDNLEIACESGSTRIFKVPEVEVAQAR